jgi:hypothetical protein
MQARFPVMLEISKKSLVSFPCVKMSKKGQRQKSDFCMPDFSKTGRAASKVEQKSKKLGKYSTDATKNEARGLESRIKIQKIEKMFYSFAFAKAVWSQITVKSQ